MKYSLLAAIIASLLHSHLAWHQWVVIPQNLIFYSCISCQCQCDFDFTCSLDFGTISGDDALDVVELCAGSHHLSSAAVEHQLRATALDAPQQH